MSIKSDVLEHLITHPNEVVSLTALASKLDVTLDQVRSAVSNLRTGAVRQGENSSNSKVKMSDQIHVVSRGYAVKYIPPADAPKPTSSPADMPKQLKLVPSTSDTTPLDQTTNGHVINDRPPAEVLLDKLEVGPITRKVLRYVIERNGEPVRSQDIIEDTDLTRAQVYGALYSTLTSKTQRNPEAMNYFEKTAHGQYRFVADGNAKTVDETGLVGTGPGRRSTQQQNAGVPTPTFTRTPVKAPPTKESTTVQKRLFEELRTLPDGSILIEDENGNVYKAREV